MAKAMNTPNPPDGPVNAMPRMPRVTKVWPSSIQERRWPRRLPIQGSWIQSTKGAQRNLVEMKMPTQLTKPMALSATPSARSQKPSVTVTRTGGMPVAIPKITASATLGWFSEARTCRMLARGRCGSSWPVTMSAILPPVPQETPPPLLAGELQPGGLRTE